MSTSINKDLKAKKIQSFYKFYKINNKFNKFKKLELDILGISLPFNDFTKIMRKKQFINDSKDFLDSLKKYTNTENNISAKILLSAYLINYYADEILDKPEDRHPIDKGILEWSNQLINLLEETNKNLNYYKKLNIYTNNFTQIFNQWKLMDKNRTIERIIISYNNRCDHIETINKENNLEEEQKKIALNELEFQKSELLNNIKYIDQNFNIEFLKENYKQIYNDLKKNWEQILKQTGNTMKKAYYDMITQELEKGNSEPIYKLFIEISKRILLITPEKRKQSLAEKLNENKIYEMLIPGDWNEELIKHINLLGSIILMFGAPADDEVNKKWVESLNYINKFEYHTKLPETLIQMEEKLDRIYQLIIQNNKMNHK